MKTKNYSAQMLLVGFHKSWLMSTVFDASGFSRDSESDIHFAREVAPFLPSEVWQLKTPVRAYVAAQWPKLSEWLIRNGSDKSKMLSVIPQIEKLKSKSTHAKMLDIDDVREASRHRAKSRQIHASNAIARSIQESTQRGAWNTCKA